MIDLNPARAARVAQRFGFANADTDAARGLQRLSEYEAPMLLIATYHATHLEIAELALSINPATRIMLEKPPVATIEQLHRLDRLRRGGAYIEIGYNRRHPDMIAQARDRLASAGRSHRHDRHRQGAADSAVALVFLAVAGDARLPATPATGSISAAISSGPRRSASFSWARMAASADGTISLIICYADGSRATIVVTDNGNSLRGVQEFIELRRGDVTVTIDDFLRLRVEDGARQSIRRRLIRDKGHDRMYARFIENVRAGRAAEYPGDDLMADVDAISAGERSARAGNPVAAIDLRRAVLVAVDRADAGMLRQAGGDL